MSLITLRMPADENEPWTEEAAADLVGQTTVLELGGHRALAVITAAEVIDAGEALLVTVRAPDELAAHIP